MYVTLKRRMSELTKDMILDFFNKKGGVVKNVDLVRHFKKYLQVDDPHLKGNLLCSRLHMKRHI